MCLPITIGNYPIRLCSKWTWVCSFCVHVFKVVATLTWMPRGPSYIIFPSGFVYLLWIAFILCNLLLAACSLFSHRIIYLAQKCEKALFRCDSYVNINWLMLALSSIPGLVCKIVWKSYDYSWLNHSLPGPSSHKLLPLTCSSILFLWGICRMRSDCVAF